MHATLGDHGKKKDVKESVDEMFEEVMDEARDPSKSGGSGYDLYHKDFSSAMKHAYDYAKKKFGIEIDPKEIDDKVASGPRKPSAGKTNSYRLKGKDGKKGVQIQVANLDNKKYELNMYKESVEMDEAKSKEQQIADLEKMLDRISGNTSSVKMKKFALQRKIDKLKNEELEEAVNKNKVRKIYDTIKKERLKTLNKSGYRTPPEEEVSDHIPSVMSKEDMAALIKMLAKDNYDADYLKKDLAPYITESFEMEESPMVSFTVPNVTSDMASKLERTAKEKNIEYSRKGRTVVLKGKRIDVTMLRTKMGLAQTNIPMVPVKEEVELTEKEDTAMQVAKALKKMGVKSNAKEADVIKKIPDVLKKLGMQQALNMMNRSKDYRNDMLGDILDSLQEESLDEAFVKWQVKVGAKVWRGTARNAGEAVKKARPSMGNLDLSKASVTRIDEEKVEENTMTLEEAVMLSVFGEAKKVKEDNTNDKSDDGEGMDKVQPKALKKKFKDRKDKDIDNDGDTDDSDEYLHNKRKAVSKAIDKNDNEGEEDKDEKQKKVGKSGKQTKVDVNPSLDEDMSDSEKEKKDEILKSMEKKKEQFVKKYGDRAIEVMNRTAVKMAKKNA
jgi:hypothetical protein